MELHGDHVHAGDWHAEPGQDGEGEDEPRLPGHRLQRVRGWGGQRRQPRPEAGTQLRRAAGLDLRHLEVRGGPALEDDRSEGDRSGGRSLGGGSLWKAAHQEDPEVLRGADLAGHAGKPAARKE